ncbi:MAG: hypothetical protein ISS19_00360 [Bacteroidales bacterium]|nr:hypothetical protein [Bacteroidales bacterium]
MNNKIKIIETIFRVLLWLVALHSFIIGLLLIFMPAEFMPFFGYQVWDANFFRAQGGVFHIIMSVVYLWAAYSFTRSSSMVIMTVTAKMIATIFLFLYFFIVQKIWTIIASGAVDFLMGLVVFILYYYYKNVRYKST